MRCPFYFPLIYELVKQICVANENFDLNVEVVDDEDVFYDDDFNLENYDLEDLED